LTLRLPDLDYEEVAEAVRGFVRSMVRSARKQGVVVGLSGGVDSSVTAKLCVEALGRGGVRALIMPDAEVTPRRDVEDALRLAEDLGVEHFVVDIGGAVKKIVEGHPYRSRDVRAEGNVRARVRMIMLYYAANVLDMLVAGTGDRSELLLGYFTKYGDGGVDILPIGGLYKTQVSALGRHLGLPSSIVEKPSSPQLWRGQTAEGELGISYEVIDPILHGLYDLGLSVGEVASQVGVDVGVVERLKSMVEASQHKRSLPPIAPLPRGRLGGL